MFYQNYQQPMLHAQAQSEIAVYQQKKIISANAKISEEAAKAEIRENMEIRKEYRKEYRKECRQARYIEAQIDEEGSIKISPRNQLMDMPERTGANFQIREIVFIQSTDGDGGIFALNVKIREREKVIYLKENKSGKSQYLADKLAEAGCKVLISKKSERDDFLHCFWAKIREKCVKTRVIPTHVGWIKYNGQFIFIEEGALLWDSVVKYAG